MVEDKQLSELDIPQMEVILAEIFQIPPPHLFPEIEPPHTVGQLAARVGKPPAWVWEKLLTLKAQAAGLEIDAEALRAQLAGDAPPLLLDVREPWEFATARIPGSILLADQSFPDLLHDLRSASPVVTICHHGIRSFSAAMYLKEQGVAQVRSLKGGVEVWALQVDPTMVRY